MIIISDPVDVFRILEKHGEDEFDVSRSHCAFFPCDHSLAVLFFCPEGILKGPRLYLFIKPFHFSEIETALINDLDAFDGDVHFEKARTHLLEELRKYLETRSASSFFFDAH